MNPSNVPALARLHSIVSVLPKFADRVRSFVSPNAVGEREPLPSHVPSASDRVLVLDASGSMSKTDWWPTRLAGAQSAATAYCARLAFSEPTARVAIVAYGTHVTVICPLTFAGQYGDLVSHVYRIDYMGNTSLTAGLEAAHRLLQGSPNPCQVVLLTDGQHNTGPAPWEIAATLRELAILECVGIGGTPEDVDESLLRGIASEYPDRTKRYRWIGDPESLDVHFHALAGRISRD